MRRHLGRHRRSSRSLFGTPVRTRIVVIVARERSSSTARTRGVPTVTLGLARTTEVACDHLRPRTGRLSTASPWHGRCALPLRSLLLRSRPDERKRGSGHRGRRRTLRKCQRGNVGQFVVFEKATSISRQWPRRNRRLWTDDRRDGRVKFTRLRRAGDGLRETVEKGTLICIGTLA